MATPPPVGPGRAALNAALAKLPKGSDPGTAPGQITTEPLAPPPASGATSQAAAATLAAEVKAEPAVPVGGPEAGAPTAPQPISALPGQHGGGTPTVTAPVPVATTAPQNPSDTNDQRFTSGTFGAPGGDFTTSTTPADLFDVNGSYVGMDAFRRGVLASNPYAQAIRGAYIAAEGSKFAVDPNYSPITDPDYAGKPQVLIPLLAARSKQEAMFIANEMSQWRLEQARLNQSSLAGWMGQVVGQFIDPALGVSAGAEGVAESFGVRLAEDSRFAEIRAQALRTTAGGVALEMPVQTLASGLDPLRPDGTLMDTLFATVAATSIYGGMKGIFNPLGKEVSRLATTNAKVDPLVHEATAPSTKIDWSTQAGRDRLYGVIKHLEGGGAADVGLSTAPNAMKVPEDQRAAGVGQVIPSTAREIAGELGESQLLAGKTDKEVQDWLMQPSAEPPKAGNAAIMVDGQVFSGASHNDAVQQALAAGKSEETINRALANEDNQGLGYIGKDGKYVADKNYVSPAAAAGAAPAPAGEPRTLLSGMSAFHSGEIVKQPDGTFRILDTSGRMVNPAPGSLGAVFATKEEAIAAAKAWDHRAVITEVPAAEKPFPLTGEWQTVPDNALLPGGAQVEIDVTTGARRARMAPGAEATAPAGPRMTNSERYGRYYYDKMLRIFDDPTLAAAAYNAGPEAVSRWLNNLGDPRKGKISWEDWIAAIPGEAYKETRDYLTSFRKELGDGLDAKPVETPKAESVGGGASGQGGTQHSLANAVFLDKNGNVVSTAAQAKSIRLAGQTFDIADISLTNPKGEHVAGAPLAEGTPQIPHAEATMLDATGNLTADPYAASKIHMPGEIHDISRFRFHDAEGRPIEGPLGAASATLLDKMPPAPSMMAKIMRFRRFIAETADWSIAPIEGTKSSQEGVLQQPPTTEARAAGAAQTPGNIAPGATTYGGAQALHGEAMVSAFGLEKVPTNPILRMLNSPSLVARDLVTRLTQIGGMQVKNLWGIASRMSVWTKLGLLRGKLNQAIRATDGAYARYAARVHQEMGITPGVASQWKTALRGNTGILSKKQFFEAVGKAKRYGPDLAKAMDLPPEAIEMAAHWDKEVYKPIVEKGDQHGAFTQPLEEQLLDLAERHHSAMLNGELTKAREIRTKMAEIGQWLKENRGKPTYKPDYLNRIYKQRALMARGDEFKAILRRYTPGMSEQDAEAIRQTLMKAQPFTPFTPDMIGRASSLHERTLGHIPDLALQDFLEHDISITGGAYTRQTGADVLMAEEFQGDMNLNHTLDGIVEDYDRLKSGRSMADQAKLNRQMAADLRDTRAIRDEIRGTYGLPKDPQSYMARGIRTFRNFNIATQLTGFVSAIADIARPAMVHGINESMGALLKILDTQTGAFKLARDEARMAGEAADVLMAKSSIFGHVTDSFAGTSKVEDLIQHIASARHVADGMAYFQDWMKSWASAVSGSAMLKATERLAKGTASADDIAKLARNYIDRPMAERIHEQWQKFGHDDGSVRFANSDLWTDDAARDVFRGGLNRDVNSVVAGQATPGERPLWMSQQLGGLISQFRTYGFSAMQRVLIPGLQARDRQFLLGAIAMVGLGMVTDYLLSSARGEDYSKKPWGGKLVNGIDRSGILGWVMDLNNAVEGMSAGTVGLQSAMGLHQAGDAEHVASAVVGPTASTFANLLRAGLGNKDNPRNQQAMMRLVPLYNIWQTRALFNMVAGAGNNRNQGPAQ